MEKIGKDQERSIPFSTEQSAPTPGCPRGGSAPGKSCQKQREAAGAPSDAHFSGSRIIVARVPNGHGGGGWDKHQGASVQGNSPPSLMDSCLPLWAAKLSRCFPGGIHLTAGLRSKFFTGQMLPPLSCLSGASPSPI